MPAPDDDLGEKARRYVAGRLAAVLKLAPERLDAAVPLNEYGTDSVKAVEVTLLLERDLGPLPRTLLFEYPTVGELTDYLLGHAGAAIAAAVGRAPAEDHPGPGQSKPAEGTPVRAAVPARQVAPGGRIRLTGHRFAPAPAAPASPAPGAPSAAALDIAIVGVAGRYPGARDTGEFWQNLRAGRDCVTEVPADRWDHGAYYDPRKGEPGRTYSKWGGFIDGVDEFDPLFFSIAPREAELLDPQERLFLQCAYETVEDAGYTRATLPRTVGVFVGVMYEEYQLHAAQDQMRGRRYAVGGNASSVANRVSYTLDLHGPSIALDTMCSSSLTALHLACRAIRSGECDAALVGGVNVTIHPNKYLMLAQGRFASSTGRCASFGAGGDGYVPAEGVGAVLIRPLEDAVAAGDRILGVVKGTAVNHGGRATGYTVPNPQAQADVITRALRQAGADPSDIGYVEAHGTGTELGDPIELAGLTRAFGDRGAEAGTVALGSVKSAIGHAESASGIAALTKVLLQFRHGELVPSLHAAEPNPHIDFGSTPFRLQRETSPWPAGERPRRAGISSFGAGGANAHVVVEDYPAQLPAAAARPEPATVVLSARDGDRLAEQARRLHAALDTYTDADLADIAYTLQTGREALDERLGFVAHSLDEVREQLTRHLRGGTGETGGPGAAVLDRWLAGEPVDWSALHTGAVRRRLALPTYPFARERHWAPDPHGTPLPPAADGTAPETVRAEVLSLRQESGHEGTRLRTTLTGGEHFLADHLVGGERVLPAAVQLELLRAAVEPAAGPGERTVRLTDVAWPRPVTVGAAPVEVAVTLTPRAGGATGLRVTADGSVVSLGTAHVTAASDTRPVLDLPALRAACDRPVPADRCYALHAAAGIAYGPSMRAVEELAVGDGQVLARLRAPGAAAPNGGLHPAVMDGALHAAVALADAATSTSGSTGKPPVPFAVAEAEILAPTPAAGYAHIRTGAARPGTLDIDVCDDDGRVCVRLRGLAVGLPEATPAAPADQHLLHPVWEEYTPAAAEPSEPDVVLVVGGTQEQREWLRAAHPHADVRVQDLTDVRAEPGVGQVYWIAPADAADGTEAVVHCFRLVKAFLRAGYADTPLGWTVVTQQTQQVGPADGDPHPAAAGVHGLTGSLAKEQPRWSVRLVDLALGVPWPVAALRTLPADPHGATLAFRRGRWHRQELRPLTLPAPAAPPYRPGGVYVVVGGAGGIGEAWTEYVVRRYAAQVVWIGRRPADAAMDARLDRLGALGPRPVYVTADGSDPGALDRIRRDVVARFGRVDGVVVSAIVLRDRMLRSMPESDLRAVLEAKIAVSEAVSTAFAAEHLDFVLFFSSLVAHARPPGQANYAAGSTFTDAYAEWLRRRRDWRVKVVDWGYWGSVGVVADDAHRARMAGLGQGSIEPAEAMDVLERLLGGTHDHVGFMKTAPAAGAAVPSVSVAASTAAAGDRTALRPRAVAHLKALVGATVKLAPERIDARRSLRDYGLDSVMSVELAEHLRAAVADVGSTFFFEFTSIDEVVDHLLATRPEDLARLVGEPAAEAESAPEPTAAADRNPVPAPVPAPRPAVADATPQDGDIAVIGLSGRYPGAADVDAFWDLLLAGRSAIGEVPAERWDWRAYHDPVPGTRGHTYSRWGGFLADADAFDAGFFGIPPVEARHIDPQERVFLEAVHAAIEDAGHTTATLSPERRVGVFVGAMNGNYPTGVRFWSIANRVSFLFDLRGPSMAVDSACSSSLTAVHLAVESLRAGTSDCAVAGGVNLVVHPDHHVRLSEMTMLSPGGRSAPFGADADGFVDGEGVGAVVLKPLAAAIADGDHIHGVIKGSHVNANGRTGGYTVPGPVGQSTAVSEALRRSGVPARSVSYVEAHGTGTALGDPIEITGLTRAFRHDTGDTTQAAGTGFCAIGSVKSNIGHAESASGIAGLTKVLLQMRHHTLVPSLNAETPNPHIDFDATPFTVQRTAAPWEPPAAGTPLRAGVSSFGAGGANAHVVVEEAPEPPSASGSHGPQFVVLSARDEAGLLERARRLLAFVTAGRCPQGRFADLAHTLQAGREEMAERLALHATGTDDLREQLAAFTAGGTGRWVRGRTDPHGERPDGVPAAEQRTWAPGRVLDAWVRGVPVDWAALREGPAPRRMSLPTYPFARDRYWIAPDAGSRPHPLLDRVVSTLWGLLYESVWTGEEFFLADHRVRGARVLPAAAHLELVRAAVAHAAGTPADGVELTDVVWALPLAAAGRPEPVRVALTPDRDRGTVSFEVRSADPAPVVYCTGRARPSGDTQPVLDLAGVRARCAHGPVAGADCRAAFAAAGITYGPGMHALVQVWTGTGEVLARLRLPAQLRSGRDGYLAHPAMVDAALQAIASLATTGGPGGSGSLGLPFAVERADLLGPVPEEAWAYVRPHPGTAASVDVDVCDGQGRVCVRLHRLTLRPLPAAQEAAQERPYEAAQEAAGQTPDLDVLATGLLRAQLRATGWFDGTDVGPGLPEQAAGLPPHLRDWLAESLRLLAAGQGVPGGEAPGWDAWAAAKDAWGDRPAVAAQVELVEAALRGLPDLLAGRRLAHEILFPDSSMDLLQALYQGNEEANSALADALAAHVDRRLAAEPRAQLRILEVGAGTGGTSKVLFDRLHPYGAAVAEYRYTDLSASFLRHARQQFGQTAPYLECQVLDIERPPGEQGIGAGTYDVVVATNVLHATRQIGDTLDHVRQMLRPGGVLLLNELTRKRVWLHLTFGLLEGWWRTEDPQLRLQGSPVLAPQGWRDALTAAGFSTVRFPFGMAADLDQHTVVATADDAAVIPVAAPAAIPVSAPVTAVPAPVRRAAGALVEELAAGLADVLEMPAGSVDPDRPFADLGLDSIFAVQWAKLIEERHGVEFTAARVYDYPTVRLLAAYLEAELLPPEPAPEPVPEGAQPRVDADQDLTLDDVLRRVEDGTLDIDAAEQLLGRLTGAGRPFAGSDEETTTMAQRRSTV
ncbi:SDR family NAD(P)-dependent oxidoreductase [Actinacidiphila bryophytorum]|uniref:Carrier domain-containing protein n=1 Tax=Actinacidiphila bryophytorum TaxID=1436133 RepID=A0A9W4MHS4_9ACTN|nr:SDR family NAD(P)-dependent oxidoreductase [Actinacidiphila bryophytorum]MBM9440572.1 SDR family NAD(P)-dependent oxidoreductase [Actinacidiphila bryophytorum]MBN6545200.1 SDR family NAD(P)-dependent oxidoreductase [Actinacidiphila bryophytorum]CAG7645219.1 putative Carrier domain-containing protein [Actinacidiphila bryophytorum]